MNRTDRTSTVSTCIQDRVLLTAEKVTKDGAFCIRDIQNYIAIVHNRLLTYKQVRDALYRHPLHEDGQYQHQFNGTYYWL